MPGLHKPHDVLASKKRMVLYAMLRKKVREGKKMAYNVIHYYTSGICPTNKTHCMGCRKLIKSGTRRLTLKERGQRYPILSYVCEGCFPEYVKELKKDIDKLTDKFYNGKNM